MPCPKPCLPQWRLRDTAPRPFYQTTLPLKKAPKWVHIIKTHTRLKRARTNLCHRSSKWLWRKPGRCSYRRTLSMIYRRQTKRSSPLTTLVNPWNALRENWPSNWSSSMTSFCTGLPHSTRLCSNKTWVNMQRAQNYWRKLRLKKLCPAKIWAFEVWNERTHLCASS